MKSFKKVNLLKCTQGPEVPIFLKNTLKSKRLPKILKPMIISVKEECGVSCLFIFLFLFFGKCKKIRLLQIRLMQLVRGGKHI